MAHDNYNANVASLIARVKSAPEEEDNSQKEKLESSQEKIEFYRIFGAAISATDPGTLAESWSGPDCLLALERSGTSIVLSGKYKLDASALANALMGFTALARQPSTHNVKYEGHLVGRALVLELTRSSDQPRTLLDANGFKYKVLMVIAEDLNQIKVLENPHSASPKFYTLDVARAPNTKSDKKA